MTDWHHIIKHGLLTYPRKCADAPSCREPVHCFHCGASFLTRQMALDHLWDAHGVKEIDNSPKSELENHGSK